MPMPNPAEATHAPRKPWRAWTPGELAALRRDYPAIGPTATANLIGRRVDVVRAKATILGISYMPDRDVAYRRALVACRRDAGDHGTPDPRRVARMLGLSVDHARRAFRAIREAGDWEWDVPARANDPDRIDPDDDPSPGEIVAIEAERAKVRAAKVAAEDAARLAWAAGSDDVLATAPPVPVGMVPWRLDEARWRAMVE